MRNVSLVQRKHNIRTLSVPNSNIFDKVEENEFTHSLTQSRKFSKLGNSTWHLSIRKKRQALGQSLSVYISRNDVKTNADFVVIYDRNLRGEVGWLTGGGGDWTETGKRGDLHNVSPPMCQLETLSPIKLIPFHWDDTQLACNGPIAIRTGTCGKGLRKSPFWNLNLEHAEYDCLLWVPKELL